MIEHVKKCSRCKKALPCKKAVAIIEAYNEIELTMMIGSNVRLTYNKPNRKLK